jgi:hypothetical protein
MICIGHSLKNAAETDAVCGGGQIFLGGRLRKSGPAILVPNLQSGRNSQYHYRSVQPDVCVLSERSGNWHPALIIDIGLHCGFGRKMSLQQNVRAIQGIVRLESFIKMLVPIVFCQNKEALAHASRNHEIFAQFLAKPNGNDYTAFVVNRMLRAPTKTTSLHFSTTLHHLHKMITRYCWFVNYFRTVFLTAT